MKKFILVRHSEPKIEPGVPPIGDVSLFVARTDVSVWHNA